MIDDTTIMLLHINCRGSIPPGMNLAASKQGTIVIDENHIPSLHIHVGALSRALRGVSLEDCTTRR